LTVNFLTPNFVIAAILVYTIV